RPQGGHTSMQTYLNTEIPWRGSSFVDRYFGRSPFLSVDPLPVEIVCILDNEFLARCNFVPHEQFEDLRSGMGVFKSYTPERTVLAIHRRLGELIRVHLTEALVALNWLDILLAALVQILQN